ncbi:MAG TPA: ABC transporter ATP-binding protein [Acidimicrobiales bacterium]
MTPPAGITLESVSRHYTTPAGIVRAVDGVSFDVPPGRNIAITGPSGCGKSTLLGLIGALDRPTSGRIVVGGHELSSLPERDRARVRREELGLVFQSDNLLPFLTAHENVCLQLSLTGAPEVDDRSRELLELLGVAECAEKLPDQLSGGQRQRVAVARALVHRPRVVLADEPTGSLDDESSAILMDLLLAVQREAGSTLVVVTHDLAAAGRLDRTIRIHDGRLAADSAGDPASVLEGLRG